MVITSLTSPKNEGDEVSPVIPLRRRFMAKAVGIDLGTTNSVVSAMEGG